MISLKSEITPNAILWVWVTGLKWNLDENWGTRHELFVPQIKQTNKKKFTYAQVPVLSQRKRPEFWLF